MARTTVGVLRGGTSSEYPLSLKTGAAMMTALPEETYDTKDILIGKDGMWHMRGMPVEPARALQQLDVVLNALHGGVGENGTIHRILDRAGVRYAGSRALASGLALNKVRSHDVLSRAGISMPRAAVFNLRLGMNTGEMADRVFQRFGPPYVVKAPMEGSSSGLRRAQTVHELPNAIGDTLDEFGSALVEEYVIGTHANVGIIEKFRDEDIYVLPLAQIELADNSWYYDPHAEEEDGGRYVTPGNLSHNMKRALADVARAAHRVLELSHYSDADFVVSRSGKPYLLEMNALPHLHERAAFPRMLEAVGSSVREFLEHIISLAQKRI